MTDKQLLIAQAVQLTKLGYQVEQKRTQLRKLVEAGFPYESIEILRALDEYNIAKNAWDKLEQKHLQLRATITRS